MEECNDGALKLSALAGVDCRGAQRLPHNRLTDVRGNEQRNAGSKAVALLKELVQKNGEHPSEEELRHDQRAHSEPQCRWGSVHAAHHVREGLACSDDQTEELLCAVEEPLVLLQAMVHIDDPRARKQLHDPTGRDDGRDAQLHQGATIRSQHHPHPVEGIRCFGSDYAVDRNLTTSQEDKEGDGGPTYLLFERHAVLRSDHLG
mmetsp:Transcript_48505/g.103923  ORF Transcript_48505/g.103923 Transcript_48505/m.103923 type:complete len:204 (-) Transcript_48505:300-911(-)